METTEIDVLKARAAASQSTATYWRKQCERAEAKVRDLEGLLVDAGRRAQKAERQRDEATPVPEIQLPRLELDERLI